MGKLPRGVRLTYMGLWCLADDDGYFVLNVTQIALALFGYEGRTTRERLTEEALQRLQKEGRIQRLSCEKHGLIPRLPLYRYNAGVLIHTVKRQHDELCTDSTVSLGLEIPVSPTSDRPKKAKKGEKPTFSATSDSSLSESESESESSSSTTSAPRANGRAEKNGSIDQGNERAEEIRRAHAKLADPSTPDGVRQAAQFTLQRLGAS